MILDWLTDHAAEIGIVTLCAMLLGLFIALFVGEKRFNDACTQKGGLVWQRDGRACLLPPYNRVEL